MDNRIDFKDFLKFDIRVGTIVSAISLKNAKRPAIILEISFGELGILKSSAQITDYYDTDKLLGKQVCALVNIPPKQITSFMSQCLVLGIKEHNGTVVLLTPDQKVKEGLRVS